MGLDVQVHEVNAHLSVTAVGQYTFAGLADLFRAVKAESEKRQGAGVILDVTKVGGTVPVMDMFLLGERCAKVWDPLFRIAIVPPEEWVYKFFENVARNRGVQVAVVLNQSAAEAWLSAGSPS